jgi:hypothetical protein
VQKDRIQNPNSIRDEEQALDQSIALNRIVMTMLQHQKENNKRLFIALILSLCLNAAILCGFLWYESQWETETITTTTTQEVEGDSAEINNIEGNQYKDNAVHNEGAGD